MARWTEGEDRAVLDMMRDYQARPPFQELVEGLAHELGRTPEAVRRRAYRLQDARGRCPYTIDWVDE